MIGMLLIVNEWMRFYKFDELVLFISRELPLSNHFLQDWRADLLWFRTQDVALRPKLKLKLKQNDIFADVDIQQMGAISISVYVPMETGMNVPHDRTKAVILRCISIPFLPTICEIYLFRPCQDSEALVLLLKQRSIECHVFIFTGLTRRSGAKVGSNLRMEWVDFGFETCFELVPVSSLGF